jgi:hypothetical protein
MRRVVLVVAGMLATAVVSGLASPSEAACTGANPTWTSTPDQASVATCVANASSGSTINVTGGSASWTGNIQIGTKALSIIGAGAGTTVIAGNAFTLTKSASRISGFTFNLSSGSKFVVEGSVGFRIDHNTVTRPTYDVWVLIYGQGASPSEGLIDSNNVTRGRIVHYGEDSATAGRYAWSRPVGLGTSKAIYIEDNTFNYPDGSAGGTYLNTVDGNWGCRYVARFNTFIGGRFEVHGLQGDNQRACMLWEIYSNALTNPATPNYRPWFVRGGTGMIFHNTTDGRFLHETIDIDVNRTIDTNSYPLFGRCDGSSWVDGDTPGLRGYPCRDQIGRGSDASLWNYGMPAPAQASAPAYIWRNRNPSGELPVNLNGVGTSRQNADLALQLMESRDFYTFRATFNGTTGVGEGPLSARPTSCSPGVGYWATDQGEWNAKNPGPDGQLYRCTAPNTWSLYYVPYPYPHPMATGGPSAGIPSAPTNLTVR